MDKSSVFIGSSSEGLRYAQAIKAQLGDDAEVTIWNEGLFLLGNVTLDTLLTFGHQFDFAILLLTPDDVLVSRGDEAKSPRDNVLFELGAFMSSLGPRKTFVVTAGREVKLPSDLAGLTIARIDTNRADGNVDAMVGNACHAIRTAIGDAASKSALGLLPSTALAVGYFINFVEKVCSAFSDPGTNATIKGDSVAGERDRPIDLRGRKATLYVVIPDNFREVGHEKVKKLRGEMRSMRQVVLDTPSRSFPFYTFVGKEKGDAIEFFDIPTTLTTSFEAVNYALGPVIGSDAVRDRVKQREIRNFRLTIERLKRDSVHGDDVRVVNLDYLAGLQPPAGP